MAYVNNIAFYWWHFQIWFNYFKIYFLLQYNISTEMFNCPNYILSWSISGTEAAGSLHYACNIDCPPHLLHNCCAFGVAGLRKLHMKEVHFNRATSHRTICCHEIRIVVAIRQQKFFWVYVYRCYVYQSFFKQAKKLV